jgi:hypothetical protein
VIVQLVDKIALVGPPGVTLPWVRFPAEHQDCQLVIDVKSIISVGGAAVLQTSWVPGDDATTLITVGPLSATGVTVTNITTNIGPYVRLAITPAVGNFIALSAWITPKAS